MVSACLIIRRRQLLDVPNLGTGAMSRSFGVRARGWVIPSTGHSFGAKAWLCTVAGAASSQDRIPILPRRPGAPLRLPRQGAPEPITEEYLSPPAGFADAKRLGLHDLRLGQQVTGVVVGFRSWGIYVDFGAEKEGFVPRKLCFEEEEEEQDEESDITQHIKPYSIVTAWITELRPHGKHINLCMVKSRLMLKAQHHPLPGNTGFVKDGWYPGIVSYISQKGVRVILRQPADNNERLGAVQMSELSEDFVKDASDLFAVGDEIRVRVLEPNARRQTLPLSLRGNDPEVVRQGLGSLLPSHWLNGIVHHKTDWGIFVDVYPPAANGGKVQGLVHFKNIAERSIERRKKKCRFGGTWG